jgi:hypothetical protein
MGSAAEIYLTDKSHTEVCRGKISRDMEEVIFVETENHSCKFVMSLLHNYTATLSRTIP